MPHKKKSLALDVSDRELATILAALRYHQAENLQGTRRNPRPGHPGDRYRRRMPQAALVPGDRSTLREDQPDRRPVDWEACPHDWEETSGPTTGSGAEYWFRCRRCGATKYSSVEQDGSRSEEVHPPDEDSDEVTQGRSPRKSDQVGAERLTQPRPDHLRFLSV